jgi:hypothetical protein
MTEHDLALRCDALNTLWSQLETVLGHRVHQPVYVWSVRQPEGMNEGLALLKYKKQWRICYVQGHDIETKPLVGVVTPISECSLARRIAATEYIAALQSAVEAEEHVLSPKLEAAITTLTGVLGEGP